MDDQATYSMVASTEKYIKHNAKDTFIKVRPLLEVSGPSGQFLLFNSSIEYRKNKMMRTQVDFRMKDYLRKPISMTCELM